MADGLVIAAPRSGSGKTTLTLGLIAALRARGLAVAPAKTGPDYIDAAILSRTAGREAVNLDPWAMPAERLGALAAAQAADADLLLVEGVMGLFDGAADGTGSTADLAATLGLPVVLVVDAERQSQSIAALVHGFATWRPQVQVAGVIVNRAASSRHEAMLRKALEPAGIPVLGVIPRRDALVLPDRHLGLVLPAEVAGFDAVVEAAAEAVGAYVDLGRLLALSGPLPPSSGPSDHLLPQGEKAPTEDSRFHRPLPSWERVPPRVALFARPRTGSGRVRGLPPLGQRIAVARDDAFAFLYRHWLGDWRAAGAELSFFSPLADEAPALDADAVFLPGGYPELHGGRLASASAFRAGLVAARDRGALVYGECGGFMVLGESLTDKAGASHAMAGLLPVSTRIDRPKRLLGYRRLAHASPLPWPSNLNGHEFHYSSVKQQRRGTPLFSATDALGEVLPPMGAAQGRVMGSYAHVIDVA